MRRALIILLFCGIFPSMSFAQIYDMREMATVDISGLDLERTVIIIPEGILEQHGPHLPSYTDGYRNEYFAQRAAESIVERDGWTVLLFQPIPLGAGGANQIGKQHIFPGTYHVHFSTLRSMFMDLASEFGEAGFRWIFVISDHGAQRHQLALEQAGDFFTDTYGGQMVYLSGLISDEPANPELNLSDQERLENGLDVHAGMSETSAILFLRPDLVRPGYQDAEPETSESWRDLVNRGGNPEWPGYFGAPGIATASRGARIVEARSAELTNLALRILDGFDHRTLQRRSSRQEEDEAIREYNAEGLEHARRIQEMQEDWLQGEGLR